MIMTSKIDYDVETKIKNRGSKAFENWACGEGHVAFYGRPNLIQL